jgi:hypothetical protein
MFNTLVCLYGLCTENVAFIIIIIIIIIATNLLHFRKYVKDKINEVILIHEQEKISNIFGTFGTP